MSTLLRIEMIAAALLVVFIIVHNVNHKRLRIQYSFVWLLIVLALLVAAFFPGVVLWLCGVLGIEVASNLVYLVGIFALLLITFYQTLLLSRQAEQLKRLTQIVSLEKFNGEEGAHDEPASKNP